MPLTISAQQGLINQYDYFDKQIASLNLSNYYIIKKGEFVYNKSYSNGYPYGAIKRLDFFEQGALSSLYICFSTSNINSDYLVRYFDSGKWNKQVKLISGEGARNHGLLNLSPYDFFNISIMVTPSSEEQMKISHFLNLIISKIKYLENKIEALKKYKEGIMKLCLSLSENEEKALKYLVSENELKIGRGTIIPRQEGIYPVYSSSAKNDGLFCYSNFYKYDEDLITWSIDGGGQPFHRKKHKFSITNVCGFIKIIDLVKWDYTWLYINMWDNWRHNKFDYTSKAHPSIIEEIYKIKPLSLDKQKKISSVFLVIEEHEKNLESKLNKLKEIKKYLLSNLFI